MKRVLLFLCFIFAFTLCQPIMAAESTITWTGAAGDGLWHTADNWNLERVPEEGDYVIIPESAEVTVTDDTALITLDCFGTVMVESAGHLYLAGTSHLRPREYDPNNQYQYYDKLIVYGNITIRGAGSILQWTSGDIVGDGTFTIDSGAQLVIEGGGIYPDFLISCYLVNNGELMLNSGGLLLFGGSEGPGTFDILEGAHLVFNECDYILGGNVTNGGFVYLWQASSVLLEADYLQENTGTTVLDFAGSEPEQYAKLNIGGEAKLDGILEIDLIDYVPEPGATFEVMTYGSRTGEFTDIVTEPIDVDFEVTYGDTSLVLAIEADTTPPELTNVTPVSGSTISPYIDSLTLKFNEAVWGDWNKNVTIYTADTDHLVRRLYLSDYDDHKISGNGTDTITLNVPSNTFGFSASYYILIDEGAFLDRAGNEYAGISDSSTWTLTMLSDNEAPTVPTNLRSTSKTSSSVSLEWDPSSDDYGPISYDIYGKTEDGEFVLAGSTEATSFTVIKLGGTSLTPETAYTFVVRAADACDNQSEQSNPLRVTTGETPNIFWEEAIIDPFTPGVDIDWIYYNDACYGAGECVAVGNYGTILTSTDEGLSWQWEYGGNFVDPHLTGITYGNDMFLAVAPSDVYIKSSTGEWTKIELDSGKVDFEDVTCGKKKDGSGDIFVAVGKNCLWWSEDGVNWQTCLSKPYITDTFIFQEVAADEEGNFVAVGYREKPFGNNTLLIWTSSNGKNWSLSEDSGVTGQFTGIAHGSGAFAACGGSVAHVWISTNKGDSWDKAPVSDLPTKIAYGDGLFVATAGNDIYISDTQGHTWTHSQEVEKFLVSVNYCNQSFVATDMNGKIYRGIIGGTPGATLPSIPRNFNATPGDGQVALSWTAPASDGGSAILKYQVSKDNGANWTDVELNTSYTFTELTNGMEYTFKVRAVNSEGNGEEASLLATPEAESMDECFIATAAFGSKFEPAVVLLRNFRDGYLLTNSTGKAFVEFYYNHSPSIAAYISHSEPLKALVRNLLIPVIAVVYLIMHPGSGIGVLILLSLILTLRVSRNRTNTLRI